MKYEYLMTFLVCIVSAHASFALPSLKKNDDPKYNACVASSKIYCSHNKCKTKPEKWCKSKS